VKNCNQCGKCCINYSNGGLTASAEEIKNWKNNYPYIYALVKNGLIWCDPQTGKQLERCPWLVQLPSSKMYNCKIYEHRPDDCRLYPSTVTEMLRDECEMIEPSDLIRPKQTQKKLNKKNRELSLFDTTN